MQVTIFSKKKKKVKTKTKTKTIQVTQMSQIHLPMINNFGRPTQTIFQSRLPFDSLNKITTMISATRLQMEIDEMTNIKQNQI